MDGRVAGPVAVERNTSGSAAPLPSRESARCPSRLSFPATGPATRGHLRRVVSGREGAVGWNGARGRGRARSTRARRGIRSRQGALPLSIANHTTNTTNTPARRRPPRRGAPLPARPPPNPSPRARPPHPSPRARLAVAAAPPHPAPLHTDADGPLNDTGFRDAGPGRRARRFHAARCAAACRPAPRRERSAALEGARGSAGPRSAGRCAACRAKLARPAPARRSRRPPCRRATGAARRLTAAAAAAHPLAPPGPRTGDGQPGRQQ